MMLPCQFIVNTKTKQTAKKCAKPQMYFCFEPADSSVLDSNFPQKFIFRYPLNPLNHSTSPSKPNTRPFNTSQFHLKFTGTGIGASCQHCWHLLPFSLLWILERKNFPRGFRGQGFPFWCQKDEDKMDQKFIKIPL